MAYSDSTLSRRALAARLLKTDDRIIEMTAQPGVSTHNRAWAPAGRVVYLAVYQNGRKVVYEIPLEEWSRLNRDATRIP